jgi:hypothetical protein
MGSGVHPAASCSFRAWEEGQKNMPLPPPPEPTPAPKTRPPRAPGNQLGRLAAAACATSNEQKRATGHVRPCRFAGVRCFALSSRHAVPPFAAVYLLVLPRADPLLGLGHVRLRSRDLPQCAIANEREAHSVDQSVLWVAHARWRPTPVWRTPVDISISPPGNPNAAMQCPPCSRPVRPRASRQQQVTAGHGFDCSGPNRDTPAPPRPLRCKEACVGGLSSSIVFRHRQGLTPGAAHLDIPAGLGRGHARREGRLHHHSWVLERERTASLRPRILNSRRFL